jgi:hypothetical protein
MRITIDLPDLLLRKAKTLAGQNGLQFDELVIKYIENGLNEEHEEPFSVGQEQVPLPVFRRSAGAQIPARTNAEIFEILEGKLT